MTRLVATSMNAVLPVSNTRFAPLCATQHGL
jgi:hypothetical protein